MSKKKKPKTKRPPFQAMSRFSAGLEDPDGQDRPIVALTVAWALTFVCTAGAQVLAWIFLWLAGSSKAIQGAPNTLVLMGNLLVLVAAITGAIGILLTPLVYRIRRVPPPPTFTIMVLLAGCTPWLIILMRYFGFSG